MRLYNYLNERIKDYPDIRKKDIENIVKEWLKLNPDTIKFNSKVISQSEVDIDMIKDEYDVITIKKGDMGVQVYRDGDKLKTRKL